jgi:hypothetical protein
MTITQTVNSGTSSVAHVLAEKPYIDRDVPNTATVQQTRAILADLSFLRQYLSHDVNQALCPFWQATISDEPKNGSIVQGPLLFPDDDRLWQQFKQQAASVVMSPTYANRDRGGTIIFQVDTRNSGVLNAEQPEDLLNKSAQLFSNFKQGAS